MKPFIYIIAALSATLLLLTQCDNDKGFPAASYPRILTLPVTNVGPGGATFHATTLQAGTDEVVNRGFVWGLNAGVTALNGERIDVGPGSGDFDATVSFGLVKGSTYYVKAFAATGKMLAYGPVVEFVSDGSLPPDIASFSPTTAAWRDTVTITGSGFSYISGSNVVKFGTVEALVIKSTESSIQCTVPPGLTTSSVRISVKAGTGEALSTEYFNLITPVISGFSPTEGTIGTVVTITGTHFSSSIYENVVKFDTHVADVVSASPTKLVVKVPRAVRKKDNAISVTLGGVATTTPTSFRIAAPVITGLSVAKAKIGDSFKITGYNFNDDPGATVVMVGDNPAVIQELSNTSITVSIPSDIYDTRFITAEVLVAEQSALSTQTIELQDVWLQKEHSPSVGYGRAMGVAFAINGKGYVGLGVSNDNSFWRYDPASNVWSEVAPFPGGARWTSVSFVIGNFAYVGLGGNGETDFWRYDPAANHWTQIADFPFASNRSVGFANNGRGYVAVNLESDNFWEYNPTNNSWTKKPDYPGIYVPYQFPATGFSIGSDLYVYSSDGDTAPNLIYRYNTMSNGWSTVTSPEHHNNSRGETGFSVGGFGYIRADLHLFKYNPATDTWQTDIGHDVPGYRNHSLAIEINGKVYFGCGEYLSDWWEFDPMYE